MTPYEFRAPITDAALLALRLEEIDDALGRVAPHDPAVCGHVLLVGERRSGRTSVLQEIVRRAMEERRWLAVRLRPTAEQLTDSNAFVKHILVAAVEQVASAAGAVDAAWYRAWLSRTHLRVRDRVRPDDLLHSALVYAGDPNAGLDPTLLANDLRTLRHIAEDAGWNGIVYSLDDASDLTEDAATIEHLLHSLDEAGQCTLLLAALPTAVQHFDEAASPCLLRFQPCPLTPFPLQDVLTCLRSSPEGKERMGENDYNLARDVLRLTGGNPFEIMLVASNMWLACELGEAERFALTPSVLDRVVHQVSQLTGGDELLEGAKAIRRLGPEQASTALEFVALSRLSIEQIAIARALGIASRDEDRVRGGVTGETVQKNLERVRRAASELEEAGLLQLTEDGERFVLRGGRPASVLLKYQAGHGVQPIAAKLPFDYGFLRLVGRTLIRQAFSGASVRLGCVRRLGFGTIESRSAVAELRHSPRRAVNAMARDDFGPVARSDLPVDARSNKDFDRIRQLIAEPTQIVFVSAGIAGDHGLLEHVELWELRRPVTQHEFNEHLAEATEMIVPIAELAGLRWRGTEGHVLEGSRARTPLMLMSPAAADFAISATFGEYADHGSAEALVKATALADAAVDTARTHQPSYWYRDFMSMALSRSGFLKSFDDDRLDEAHGDLAESLDFGSREGWVTHWNLANVALRQGRKDDARRHLDDVERRMAHFGARATVLFYSPPAAIADALIEASSDVLPQLLRLQRAVLEYAMDGVANGLAAAVAECDSSEAPDVVRAARLAALALPGASSSVRNADS